MSLMSGDTYLEKGKAIAERILPQMMSREEWEEKCYVADEIQKMVKLQRFPKARVFLFGSTVSGLAEMGCDIDLACDLYGNGHIELLQNEVDVVSKIGTAFQKEPFSGLEVITGARCPIVKNTPDDSFQTDFHCDAKFDLSFRMNGVYNSRLLRKYFTSPAIRTAAVFLKQWGKDAGVIDPRNGLLSSYALTLMFIHYAIRSGHCKYIHCGDYHEIDITAKLPPLEKPPTKQPQLNTFYETVGKLIVGFIRYYALQFKFQSQVVTIRTTSVLTKSNLGWRGDDGGISIFKNIHNYHLSIQDPYEQRGKYRQKRCPEGKNVSCGLRRPNFKYIVQKFRSFATSMDLEDCTDLIVEENIPKVQLNGNLGYKNHPIKGRGGGNSNSEYEQNPTPSGFKGKGFRGGRGKGTFTGRGGSGGKRGGRSNFTHE